MPTPIEAAAAYLADYRKGNGWALRLEGLGLRADDLQTLKAQLSGLPRLRNLWLSENRLEDVPDWLFETNPGLRRIELAGNLLTDLPLSITKCKELRQLNLRANKLAKLPDVLATVYSLAELDVSQNMIRSLPQSLGALTNLTELGIDYQLLRWPPPEVLRSENPTQDALHFLRTISANGGDEVREGKVILVGNGGHGKTTIRLWLENNQFAGDLAATRGGEISRIPIQSLSTSATANGIVNIWDFGGQEQYRAAQRSLFSRDALFIVVCKSRGGTIDEGNVPHWLQLIAHTQRDAKVLLVFTHHDSTMRRPSIDSIPKHLKYLVPSTNVLTLDATRADGGILSLRERIAQEITGSDAFTRKWPIPWLRVRRQLSEATGGRALDYVSYSEFERICGDEAVPPEQMQPLAQAISLLDMGDTYWRSAGIVALNPEWLLKAIAYVMDDSDLALQNGILNEALDCPRIWRDQKRPASQKPIVYEQSVWIGLLGIMASQGLAYRLTEQDWIIPELVTQEQPSTIPWESTEPHLKRLTKLDGQIFGLAALLVHGLRILHRIEHTTLWQGGAFFRLPEGRGELFFHVDGRSSAEFEARGPNASQLLEHGEAALIEVTRRYWPEARTAERRLFTWEVPCLYAECDGTFFVSALNGSKNKYEHCNRDVSHRSEVASLLYGQAMPEAEALPPGRSEYPRAIFVEEVDGYKSRRRKLYVASELSMKPVKEATSGQPYLEFEDEATWFVAMKTVARVAVKTITSIDFPNTDGAGGTNHVWMLPKGLKEFGDDESVPSELENLLKDLAFRVGMRKVWIGDGFKWVTKAEADQIDPTKARPR